MPANLLLPTVIKTTVHFLMTSSNGAAGQFVQHINYTGGDNDKFGLFIINEANFRDEWNAALRNTKDINQLITIGRRNNQPQYLALGLINKVMLMQLVTDAYGDIPYDEAGRGDENGLEYPHYQAQEEAYQHMLSDLEEANQLLADLPHRPPSKTIFFMAAMQRSGVSLPTRSVCAF